MHWRKVTLIGVGLLGGSLGLALRRRGLAARVEGYVRRAESIGECVRVGAVDAATQDLRAAVEGADLIVFCTPLAQMRALAAQMLPSLTPGVLVTDVGSVKAEVVGELEPLLESVGGVFIGSHPMAGGEKMGVSAAREGLFEGAICVVTPTPRSPQTERDRLLEFWKRVGARAVVMSAEQHDEFVSRSSHLVHVVAAELANYVLSPAHPRHQALLCANGFRDTTRVASGSPEMWRDIALANRRHLARVLGVVIEDLQAFQQSLAAGDAGAIEEFFVQAKERRDRWCATPASPSPE